MTLSNCFQVLDEKGNPVTLESLDKDACDLWDCPYHSKYYASPDLAYENWFDCIGWAIANPKNNTEVKDWLDVISKLLNIFDAENLIVINTEENILVLRPTSEEEPRRVNGVIKYLSPYIDLINVWKYKGYIPKQIIE